MLPGRALAAVALAAAITPVTAAAQSPAAPARAEIEAIVRDYLMREPRVVYDALQELQKRQDQASAERRRGTIDARAAALFADPADPAAGDPKASVTVVEFFDYRCGYCRQMVPDLRALLAGDRDVRVVFKDLPVLGPESVEAAKAALAVARQDAAKYVPFHLALMGRDDLGRDGLRAAALEVGLDADRMEEGMKDPAVMERIEANYALARDLGVEGTPALVVGRAFLPGAVGLEELRRLVNEARAG